MMKVSYFIAGDNNRLTRVDKNAALELERRNAALLECPTEEWDRYEPVYKLMEPVEEKNTLRENLFRGLLVLIGAGAYMLGGWLGALVAALH